MPIKFSKPGISVWEVIILFFCIVIVAVLLLPIFMFYHHREYSGGDTCLSNMKQLSTALIMEAQDNKDIFPIANKWDSGVTDKIFDCPTTTHKGTAIAPDYLYVAANFHNQNGLLSNRKMNDIKNTAEVPALVELANPGKPGQTAYVSDAIKISDDRYEYDPQFALMNKIDRFRHNGSSIVAFVDGHVNGLKASELNMALLRNAMSEHEPVIK